MARVPFNHPIMFAASKIAAPLVAGNTVMLKLAEATPALEFGKIANTGLPPGALGLVAGDGCPDREKFMNRWARLSRCIAAARTCLRSAPQQC
nr:aldehyde dehydrogenase family protein [Mycolicibacterium baixiangningiae]